MKIIIITLIALFFIGTIIAQSPNSFNYQAVVRDAQGQILENQSVSIKMSILIGSVNGNSIFEEIHNITSTKLGIVNLQIGNGQNQSGSLSSIDWKNNNFWLKVEMDETGGTNFSEMGTSQLISVPYAMHAETATYVDDADANPNNEIQSLSFNTNNNELSISNGNSVTIPTGGTDGDADPTNEIQNISKNGNTVTLSKNGGSFVDEVNDSDADNTNELQNLNLSGNTLSISQGNQVDLSSMSSPWQTDGTGIKYEGPKVKILDPNVQNESVIINPYVINVNDKNDYQSYLSGNQLTFQNLQNTPKMVAEYGYWGVSFFEPGNPIQYLTKFDKDSLWQYDPGVGLLMPSTTKMIPGHLTLDYGTFETTRLSGFGLDITSKDIRDLSLDVNSGLQLFEYVSPSDRFLRMSLGPDSLNMYNSTKWKTTQLGIDPDFGSGMLKLFHGGGMGELAHLAGYPEGGGFLHFVADGEIRAEIDANFYGSIMSLYGMNNSLQYLAATDDMSGGAYVALSDTLGSPEVQLWVTRDTHLIILAGEEPVSSRGHFYSSGEIYSPIIQSVIEDTIWAEMNNFGFETEGGFYVNPTRRLKSEDWAVWDPRVLINTSQFGEGTAVFNGTNGNLNTQIFGLREGFSNDANFGAVYVYNDAGIPQAGIEVDPVTGNGILWGNIKNFRVDHPTEPNKDIVYASLEGPEAAAYTRGTSQIENGKIFVQFPEHFQLIANSKTMTVTLTPLYSKTFGLAVVEKTNEGFWVEELMDGKGNFEFDWEVKCVRKGHENFEVVRDKIKSKSMSSQQSERKLKSMVNKNKKHHLRPTNDSYIKRNQKK